VKDSSFNTKKALEIIYNTLSQPALPPPPAYQPPAESEQTPLLIKPKVKKDKANGKLKISKFKGFKITRFLGKSKANGTIYF
jgi:hypothetical protein